MSTSYETNHMVRCIILSHATSLIQMPSKKRRGLAIFVCNSKAKEAEKIVWLGLGRKLSRGSYFNQEQWLKELNE